MFTLLIVLGSGFDLPVTYAVAYTIVIELLAEVAFCLVQIVRGWNDISRY